MTPSCDSSVTRWCAGIAEGDPPHLYVDGGVNANGIERCLGIAKMPHRYCPVPAPAPSTDPVSDVQLRALEEARTLLGEMPRDESRAFAERVRVGELLSQAIVQRRREHETAPALPSIEAGSLEVAAGALLDAHGRWMEEHKRSPWGGVYFELLPNYVKDALGALENELALIEEARHDRR